MSIISDMIKYSRLALDLRIFLQNRITLEQSKRVLKERLRIREQNFITLVQKGIYQNPRNPFCRMLRAAGCEFGDIETMVNGNGIEPTLQKLLAEGVYLSWEEFKGKKDVVRGSSRFQFKQRDLDNPFIPGWYEGRSSGSRSGGTRTKFDLKNRLEKSYYRLPMLAASNAMDYPLGCWKEVPPSMNGISNVLEFWIAGKPIARWFSTVDERQVKSSLRDRLALRYILYGGRLWGAKLARPEYINLGDAHKISRWMADTRKQFGGCSLSSSVSSAIKVCHAAMEHELDIRGSNFFTGGEPLTEAKRRHIEASGASVIPEYAFSEVGRIGIGCSSGRAIDDLHLLSDSVALIQHQRRVEHIDLPVSTFLFTPLLI